MMTNRISDNAYNDAIYERTIQLLYMFARRIQDEMDKVVDLSYTVLADNVIQESLTQMKMAANDLPKWIEAKHTLDKRVGNINFMNENLATVNIHALSRPDTEVYTGAYRPELSPNVIALAHDSRGREVWISGEENPGKLTLVRDVREVADLTLNSIAIMVLDVNVSGIVTRCIRPLLKIGMPLLCAIDFDGVRVYSSHADMPGEYFGDVPYRIVRAGDDLLFCVQYTLPDSNWTYTAALQYGEIADSLARSSRAALLVACAAFAIALMMGTLLISSLLRHFKALSDKYDAFARNEWQPVIPDPYKERRDEIGSLHRQFNFMAQEHRRIVDEMYMKQQLLLEAQLSQLRTQIQPHFLYNTLESIYCLAEKADDSRIAVMTASLGRMLHITLSDQRDMITIAEDVEIAKEYMNIQLIRYCRKLQTEFSVSEEHMQCLIPSMTLQPLVENAVRHAAEEMLECCVIRMYSRPNGEYIDIIVEDNGPGMPEDILEKLSRGEIVAEGFGIGLININKRIKLAYRDEQCGLFIECANGVTRVTVRIRKEEKYDQTAAC